MRLFLSAVGLALTAIRRNKLRAALTVLGIFIGITAVVLVTALAGGASESVGSTIDNFGSNLLFVFPERVQRSGARGQGTGRLTDADGRAILRESISVANVAPWLSSQAQVVHAEKNTSTTVAGTTLSYFPVRRFEVAEGEQWTENDEATKAKVCVIGRTTAENLFGPADPVGRTIRIAGAPFRIVGQLATKGTSPFGEDQDDRILMPIGSYRGHVKRSQPGRVDMLLVSATSDKTASRAEAQIGSLLRQRHRIAEGSDPDFTVASQAEIRATQQAISEVLTGLLLSVAAVSLVVGGIGVMNIMLVSVAERTREIGIRLSIGAREKDILLQFLVEAIVLSLIGGVLGIVLGGAATIAAGKALGWNTAPTPEAFALAIGTSAFIGVAFGFVPARRAARLDPIEALRQD